MQTCSSPTTLQFHKMPLHPYNRLKSIWHIGLLSNPTEASPCSRRSGFMEHIASHSKNGYSKSTVTMLPLLDLQPSNERCIYVTLLFVENQSKKLDMETPCILIDHSLLYKANKIITEKNLIIVCHLSGFHTLVSFLGSIGIFMGGCRIEVVLVLVFSTNAVKTFSTRKDYSGVLRSICYLMQLHMALYWTL